jgi:hypothetical protein
MKHPRNPISETFEHTLLSRFVDAAGIVTSVTDSIWLSRYKELSDENSDKLRFNPCRHERSELSFYTANHFDQKVPEGRVAGQSLALAEYVSTGYTPIKSWARSLIEHEALWQDMGNFAFAKMCPKLKPAISILNFVYELRELMSLFKLWERSVPLMRNLTNAQLNYAFGWRPFLSDIVQMLNIMEDLRKQLNKLLRGEHKVHTRNFQTKFKVKDRDFVWDDLPSIYPNGPVYHDVWKHSCIGRRTRGLAFSTLDYNASLKFTYHLPALRKKYAGLKAMLDAFGVYWDPKVIWNAIPFSFVVDWFVGVGNYLSDAFSNPNFPVEIRVFDFCHSLKVEVGSHTTLIGSEESSRPEEYRTVGEYKLRHRAYWRRIFTPRKKSLLTVSGWDDASIDKVRLMIGLLYSTTPRSKKRKRPKAHPPRQ